MLSHTQPTVLWTLRPSSPPAVVRTCPRCDDARPFDSSGRFRLNANKRRLDAWLIYRCRHCEATWNLPIVERVPLARLSAADLRAFESSCPERARRIAFDVGVLKPHGTLQSDASTTLDKPAAHPVNTFDLVLANPLGVAWRLDRVLATGLGIRRADLPGLWRCGALEVHLPRPERALRRPVADGTRCTFRPSAVFHQKE